jgi:hypothetical protein
MRAEPLVAHRGCERGLSSSRRCCCRRAAVDSGKLSPKSRARARIPWSAGATKGLTSGPPLRRRRAVDRRLRSGRRRTAALAVVEAVTRLLPGFIGNGSLEEESFRGGLRVPAVHAAGSGELAVPAILLSGDHQRCRWRRKQRLRLTASVALIFSRQRGSPRRPRTLARDRAKTAERMARLYVVLLHHPVRQARTDRATAVINTDARPRADRQDVWPGGRLHRHAGTGVTSARRKILEHWRTGWAEYNETA